MEVDTGAGAGLDCIPPPVAVPVPTVVVVPVLGLELALVFVLEVSGRVFHGNSGRRDGKNLRGGTPIACKDGSCGDSCICALGSSISASPPVKLVLPSRPVERRREVKSVKSTVRERAGTRRMDGWRVRGGAVGTEGDGGPHESGEASRSVPQFSRREVERST